MISTRWAHAVIDRKTILLIGALFLGIASVLAIQELKLGLGWCLSLLLACIIGYAIAAKREAKTLALFFFAIVGLVGPAVYFLYSPDLSYYVSTGVYFAGALLIAVNLRPAWDPKADNTQTVFFAFSAIASSMAFFWLTYYRFLTEMGDAFVIRRLIFTVFLLAIGIALTLLSRRKSPILLGVSGLIYMLVAIGKALLYDTTHLEGIQRIGVFLIGGLLLVAAALATPKNKAVAQADADNA
jgi:hypothetical protein